MAGTSQHSVGPGGGAQGRHAVARDPRGLSPAAVVAALLALMVGLWGMGAAVFHPAPPTDSLEQLLFAQELRLAYAKHPPLPTWLLWAASRIAGPSVGLTFLLGALCASVALLILYLWARAVVGAPRAALATLLGSLVVYYNTMSGYYNHNTVQLPFVIASIALFHRALLRGRLRDWLALGAAAGLALLVKLSVLVIFAAMAAFVLGWRRDVLRTRAPAIAAAAVVALAIAGPPLFALYAGQAEASHYVGEALFSADASLARRATILWNFLASAAGSVAPALLAFAALGRRSGGAPPLAAQPVPLGPFLAVVGFGPLAIIAALALGAGAHLLSPWATPFFSLLTLWLVVASPWRIDAPARLLQRALLVVVTLQALLWATTMLNEGRLPNFARHSPKLALSSPALSTAVANAWRERSAAPLPTVVAASRNGAPLALGFRGRPLVVDGNRSDFDRLITPDARERCGLIVLTGPVDPRDPRPSLPPGVVLDPVDALDVQIAERGETLVVAAPDVRGQLRHWRLAVQWPEPRDGSACR
jgi:4-amino-4-deoxy-L-arabinose transferase-like glycosyltransferase